MASDCPDYRFTYEREGPSAAAILEAATSTTNIRRKKLPQVRSGLAGRSLHTLCPGMRLQLCSSEASCPCAADQLCLASTLVADGDSVSMLHPFALPAVCILFGSAVTSVCPYQRRLQHDLIGNLVSTAVAIPAASAVASQAQAAWNAAVPGRNSPGDAAR